VDVLVFIRVIPIAVVRVSGGKQTKLEGDPVLFEHMRIRIAARLPISGVDSVVFVPLILHEPARKVDIPMSPIHVNIHRHKSCLSVDVREQRKEPSFEEHLGAESKCTKGVAGTEHPVAGEAKTRGG
jgi:hypothetical protein